MRQRTRNNAIAGFFVLATIIGFLAVTITMSDMTGWGDRKTVEAAFPLEIGAPGLYIGSEVAVGSITVGRVTKIERRLDASAEFGQHIRVAMSVPDSLQLSDSAHAELVVPLIGSGTIINVFPGDGEPIGSGVVLKGRLAPPIFLGAVGITEEEIVAIQQTIASINSITEYIDTTLQEEGPEAVELAIETLEKLSRSMDDAEAMIADARATWPEWKQKVDQSLANVAEASDQAPAVMTNVDEAVSDVRDTVASLRPDLEKTAENAAQISSEVREVTLARLNRLLERGEEGLNSAIETVAFVDDSIRTEMPGLAAALGNMRIASNNMKLAMIEIRAQPWKLLYSPGDDEVRDAQMYNAVRTYANAVSDLNAAAESLKALHDRHGPDLNPDDETLQRVLSGLEKSFTDYQRAEETWFNLLVQEGGRP
ncbi:MAG: MlaD family protein [Phycisphaerales bacterium]